MKSTGNRKFQFGDVVKWPNCGRLTGTVVHVRRNPMAKIGVEVQDPKVKVLYFKASELKLYAAANTPEDVSAKLQAEREHVIGRFITIKNSKSAFLGRPDGFVLDVSEKKNLLEYEVVFLEDQTRKVLRREDCLLIPEDMTAMVAIIPKNGFKVGDIVRPCGKADLIGRVIEVCHESNPSLPIKVQFDRSIPTYYKPSDLVFLAPAPLASTLAAPHPIADVTSGGKKNAIGNWMEKPRMSLIPYEGLEAEAQAFSFGELKYATHNWRKGLKVSYLLDAALRHTTAAANGETLDPESGVPHLGCARACMSMAVWTMKHRPDLDDRYKPDENTK